MSGKIWIISEFYYPIVTSTGYYITEIAEYLSLKGMDVHVISTEAKYNEESVYKFKKKEIHNGVNIIRVKVGNIDKNNFLKRTFRLLKTSISLFIKAMQNVKRGDTIMVVTNPAFIILLMPIMKLLKGISYSLLVHDIFPENLAAIGGVKSTSWTFKILNSIFNRAYKAPETCISIGRDMSEVLAKKIGNSDILEYIPNWSDIDDVYPLKKEDTKLYNQLYKQKEFVFQFAGNLGHAQGLDNILSAIKLIKNPAINFLFVGGGAKYETISEFSKNSGNVQLIGFQDRITQNDFLNACDISIVTLNNGMYGLGVPSKSYNIMAAGKPILMIGDERSEIALCIKEYNLGWIVKPNDPESLCSKINEIYNDQNTLDDISKNARKAAEEVFSKNKILEKYYNLFNS